MMRASCLVNPRAGHELELNYTPVAADKKQRIAVIGAGPAGLGFATVAAGRGHDVTLFDRDSRIGGQFNMAKKVRGYLFVLPASVSIYRLFVLSAFCLTSVSFYQHFFFCKHFIWPALRFTSVWCCQRFVLPAYRVASVSLNQRFVSFCFVLPAFRFTSVSFYQRSGLVSWCN
jgi:hypothetical protein